MVELDKALTPPPKAGRVSLNRGWFQPRERALILALYL